jgi:hypothetical protein
MSVVTKNYANFVAQSMLLDTLLGFFVLFFRDRNRRDLAASFLDTFDGKSTPATANLEYVIRGLNLALVSRIRISVCADCETISNQKLGTSSSNWYQSWRNTVAVIEQIPILNFDLGGLSDVR